jgi:hypothetical protein
MKMPYIQTVAKEFLNLKCQIKANQLIKVEAPSGSNFHDDTFDSANRSLYICHGYHNKNKTILGVSSGLFGHAQLVKRSYLHNQSNSNRGRAGSNLMRNPNIAAHMNKMVRLPAGGRRTK